MSSDEMQRAFEKAQAVKRTHEQELMSRANVVGVGVGLRRKGGKPQDRVAVIVMVARKVPVSQLAPKDVIPAEIEGVPVDVQEVGQFQAHQF
jgi:hypothetical protein